MQIRTSHGTYWHLRDDGVVVHLATPDPQEFERVILDDGSWAIVAPNGRFVTAEVLSTPPILVANRDLSGPEAWEKYRPERRPDGAVALRADDGRGLYVRAVDTGDLHADDHPGPESWEHFTLEGEPGPEPGPGPGPGAVPFPILGRLRVEDGAWCDDTGPRLPVGSHAGDLLSQAVRDMRRAITLGVDPAASAGYLSTLFWLCLGYDARPGDYWYGREVHPWKQGWTAYQDTLAEVLYEIALRGMRVNVCGGDLKGLTNHQEDQLFDAVCSVLVSVEREAGPVAATFSIANEVLFTGDDDDQYPAELERLAARVRTRVPGLLVCLTSYAGIEEPDVLARYTSPGQPFVEIHSDRGGRWYDKTRHRWNDGYEIVPQVGRLLGRDLLVWLDSEPAGYGTRVSAIANWHELDAEGAPLATLAAVCGRGYPVFFSSHGVILDGPLDEMPGYTIIPRLVRRIESVMPDLHRFDLVHVHPRMGDRRAFDIPGFTDESETRVEQAVDRSTGRALGVVHGPESPTPITNLLGGRCTVIHPETAAESALSGPVSYRRGRLLLTEAV